MKRYILIACGCALLVLGAVGSLLPVLPTTPFVLLAATCFSASSPRAYRLLMRSRFFAPYIEHYQTGGGIGKAAKVRGIVVLWAMLGISAIASRKLWLVHLLMIKSKPAPDQNAAGPLPPEAEG
ncbi:MAG TPA: YbaN family protein [Clostridia bacterium]|nr:YbaN family protein [Clostridia bacterium]